MAIFRFMGYSNPLERFLLLFIFMYIVFRSIAARKVHLYIHFTPIFSTFHSFQNTKTVPIFNQCAYIFIFCRFLPYCLYLPYWDTLPYLYHTGINI